MAIDITHLEIRRLGEKDVILAEEIVVLFSKIFQEKLSVPNSEHIKTLLQRSEFICIGATMGDKLIAGLTAHILPSLYNEHPEIFIYDIAVKPKYQGKGIGKALLEKLQPFAKDLKIKEVFVNADGDDDDALKFYKKIGGKPMKVVQFTFE